MYTVNTTDVFEKQVKKLLKKYRRIQKDLIPFIDKLETGELVGSAVPGFNKKLYKARVPSSDQKKGKRGGFRVLYYLVSEDDVIYLLTLYAKAKKSDIRHVEISRLLKEMKIQ